jgi:hypothetical protein
VPELLSWADISWLVVPHIEIKLRRGLKSGNTGQHSFRIFIFQPYMKKLTNENTQNIHFLWMCNCSLVLKNRLRMFEKRVWK